MSEQFVKNKSSGFGQSNRWGVPNTAAVSIPCELSFENIHHSIDGNEILRDISLTAKSGTVTCLLGPSGSGKTTLLRIAAGMVRQSAGRVLQDHREIGGPATFLPPEKRGIGLVFQDYALFPHLNILDNVCFGLAHIKRSERKPQATQMLERVGLSDRAGDYPHHLSGGEQQRVALARAMVPRPGVLLLDEPFSGLDSRLRDAVREETLGVLRETRATSIIVTHDPEEALKMGDQIVLLNQGCVEQIDSGRQLYSNPTTLFAAEFFSEINVFEGIAEQGHVTTPLGPVQLPDLKSGEKAVAAVRTGAIAVSETSDGLPQQACKGRIISTSFTGDFDHLRIGVGGAEEPIRARVSAGSLSEDALAGRKEVWLVTEPNGCFGFKA